jgi:hypothetical protein
MSFIFEKPVSILAIYTSHFEWHSASVAKELGSRSRRDVMHEMLTAYFYARHREMMRERRRWREPSQQPARPSFFARLLQRLR